MKNEINKKIDIIIPPEVITTVMFEAFPVQGAPVILLFKKRSVIQI
jgi:hypothetical protein